MTITRARAALIGALFLIATITFFIGDRLIQPVLTATDPIAAASASASTLDVAALLTLIDGIAVVAIAVLFLPILGIRQSSGAGYLAIRTVELTVIAAYACAPLLLTRLSPGADSSVDLLLGVHDYGLIVIYLLNAVAGLILCTALWRTTLVPRTLSGIGLVGYATLGVFSTLAMLGTVSLTDDVSIAALAPGGLFEILLPLYLIIRGFRHQPQVAAGN